MRRSTACGRAWTGRAVRLSCRMGGDTLTMLTILLIVLIVLVLAGGFGYGGGRYRTGGIGLGGVLLIILLVLLLAGAL